MKKCTILSGKEVSEHVYSQLKIRVNSLRNKNIQPGLAAILVGSNPASQIYINMKTKRFHIMGMKTQTFKMSVDVKESNLLELIEKINKDPNFHGILVQLPLPKHIDSKSVINSIHPEKMLMDFILKMLVFFLLELQDLFLARLKE